MSEESGLRPLNREELDELAGQELPEPELMSLHSNVAIPIDAVIAADVLSGSAMWTAAAVEPHQM